MSALDKKLRGDLQEQLREIHRTLGTTFINVTHDQEEAMHMSDRIAIMNHGRIEQCGTAFDLYRHPNSRFVAEFIGKSNMFEGGVEGAGDASVFVAGGLRLPLQMETPPKGPVELMIRPEDVVLDPAEGHSHLVRLPATVLSSTYSGDRALYTVEIPGGSRMLVFGQARKRLHGDGETVTVGLSAHNAVVIPSGA